MTEAITGNVGNIERSDVKMDIMIRLTDPDSEDEMYFIRTEKSVEQVREEVKAIRQRFRDSDDFEWNHYEEAIKTEIGELIDFPTVKESLY